MINSPDLAIAVERIPTKISFWHVEAVFTGTLAGLSPFAVKTLKENVNSDNGEPSYLREGMVSVHTTMKPGEGLTAATRAAADLLVPSIGKLAQRSATQIELGQWVTDELMASVTGSIFGPKNPYQDPDVAKGFW